MRDELSLFFGVIFLLGGAMLLHHGVSTGDASQTAAIIGGATLLSLGSVVAWKVLKNWWEWRKEYRKYRNG